MQVSTVDRWQHGLQLQQPELQVSLELGQEPVEAMEAGDILEEDSAGDTAAPSLLSRQGSLRQEGFYAQQVPSQRSGDRCVKMYNFFTSGARLPLRRLHAQPPALLLGDPAAA